jgi:hypothetical protein
MDIHIIETIFKKMALTYGKAFLDQYKDVKMIEVMQNWAKELQGFRPHEIAYGLECLQERPPNVIQFRAVCRMAPPPIVKMLDRPIDKERGQMEINKLRSMMKRGVQHES